MYKLVLVLLMAIFCVGSFAQKIEPIYPQKINDTMRAEQIADMKFGIWGGCSIQEHFFDRYRT